MDSESDSYDSDASDDLEFSPRINGTCSDSEKVNSADEDDGVSVKSSSTSCSSSKAKKKVTFQTEDNLVLIREIPPRGFDSSQSDTDTAVDSDSNSNDASDSDEENANNSDSVKLDGNKNIVGKGKYDVQKPTGRTLAKIVHVTSSSLLDNEDPKKNTGKKKLVKRRIKSANAILETDRSAKAAISAISEKPKLTKAKPRAKSARRACEKPEKPTQTNTKVKKVPKNDKKLINGKITRKKDNFEVGINGSHEVDLIMQSDCLLSANEKLWRLFDSGGSNCIDTGKLDSPPKHLQKQSDKPSERRQTTNSKRPDVHAMSSNDRRLYSWLMANGNVPNPQTETPSISPMWESSQSNLTENVVT